MRTLLTLLALILFMLTGCETAEDPVDQYRGSSGELTDGLCLLVGDQVVVNHNDIEYYDYGTHLIYLKDHMSCEKVLETATELKVYAGGEEIYTMTTQPGYSSFAPMGPVIWTAPSFYPENVIAIDLIESYELMIGTVTDPREDPRIVEVLEKYGQYMKGLHAEITSLWCGIQELRMSMELSNRDQVDYYYLDPEKMGMGLFHYFTHGVVLWDTVLHRSYSKLIEEFEPSPWDAWELDWMSVLKGGESVHITLAYDKFMWLPIGTFVAYFEYPGLQYQVGRDQLDQAHGRIWLGKLRLRGEVEVD